MSYESFTISPEEKSLLRARLNRTEEVTPFNTDIKFYSLLAALGMNQEIGTIHDELSKFLFDGESGQRIAIDRLRSELVRFKDYIGVRIWAKGHRHLELRVRGLRTLLHPQFSFDGAGRVYQCVFFPEAITQIAALEGVELVSVKPWAMNTIFGGFDRSRSYYEGNMWEFINIDAVRYARLLENRQIVFWGTHDLVSHVAGMRRSAWPELVSRGKAAKGIFEEYFRGIQDPVPFSLVLPYALGMLLDDLAQPMNYESKSRRLVVDLLMKTLQHTRLNPSYRPFLLKYPPSIEQLILLARSDDFERAQNEANAILADLMREIREFSFAAA